jgi:antitoxin (DNA-binding transcriptional repressor) of toxin-antitoxin stability system
MVVNFESQGQEAGVACDTSMCHNTEMPSVNIRQLRDTRRLKAWLRAGKTVELRERDKLIAKIIPEKEPPKAPAEWPDFEARRKAMFGDRIFTNIVLEDRGRY